MRLCLSKSGLGGIHRSERRDFARVDYKCGAIRGEIAPRPRKVSAVLSGDQSAAYVAVIPLSGLAVASAAAGALAGLVIW